MSRLLSKKKNAARRQHRVRTMIHNSSTLPRLCVFVSNKHVSAQIIDDEKQITLAQSTTAAKKTTEGNLQEKAANVGADIAKKAKEKKIKKVVLDRGSHLYHGRVKALADAARKEGLEI